MKFATWVNNGKQDSGILSRDLKSVHSFRSLNMPYLSVLNYIINQKDSDRELLKKAENTAGIPINSVTLLAPIPSPHHDILCLGLNYREHVEESARFHIDPAGPSEEAIYFSKRVVDALGPDGVIENHFDINDRLDYEAELAVIIGKNARNVKPENVWDYVFGFCCFNDLSGRDLQVSHKQWYFGKSLDGFTAYGPYIVTADEFSLPPALKICSRVNGEVRQSSTTDRLIHSIEEIICELTSGMTLDAGSIIATGTPQGVGAGFTPHRCLKSGDVCEIEIEGLGVLRNTVA
ncbi:MAG: fumarylacetoacetate hydrolase family protein [Lachnospiraceae bacterium]|jgi:2-keto-4-pentenoate hydratase/2-oxohepta-3-ene-1,7-dioic acid hydratase in catechol pathway|nr:fumarylacetoacetate hydrolase family protein [Lachnospiraceae bacterium]